MEKQLKIQNGYKEKFNSLFQKGDKVKFRVSPHRDYTEVTVRVPAFMHYGNAVVFFEEVNGFCSIDPKFVSYEV